MGTCLSPFGHVTVSVGLAVLEPEPGLDPARIVTLADEALYRAKEKGRNRIEA